MAAEYVRHNEVILSLTEAQYHLLTESTPANEDISGFAVRTLMRVLSQMATERFLAEMTKVRAE